MHKMIQNVMPKEPMRAIEYTGKNVGECVEFGAGAFCKRECWSQAADDGKGVEWALCKTDPEHSRIKPGTWIVEICGGGPAIYLLMSEWFFPEHWRVCDT